MVLFWNQVEYSCKPRDGDQDGKMDPSRGRSFMQVLSEKYSPENFPYRPAPGINIVVTAGPQDPSMKDCLNLPSILVLNSSGITCAGEEKEIAALCTHVTELDLSDNKFEDWHEVRKIVSNIPKLEFLNLSSNLLHKTTLEKSCAEAFSGIHKLVLNNSKTSWETVHTLLQELPRLEELFLCLNNYDTVTCSPACCHSLKLLHITDNHLKDWCEIRKLGTMFPSLDTLILANNNVLAIDESNDSLRQLFPNLRSISLHKTGLNCWEDVEKLNSFPSLKEVRLLGIPLLEPYSTEERRKLVIARLPSVSKLNGSAVTDGEREDSERFFIRYHLDLPRGEAPQRYQELVTKYGELAPLAEVDLRPRNKAKVKVHFENKMQEMGIRLDQTVADLKRQLKPVVQLSPKNMRLFYLDKESPHGPEELKSGYRALHSYGIDDGDAFFVEPKMKDPR